jgi:hypothetical protein
MPKTPTARDRAVELEQAAVRYPEDRSEIFLEAAHEWKRAGEPERAVALWREVINAGGKDAGFARYSLAELCFEQGRDAEAWEHLRVLEDEGVRDPVPAGLVAELLAERGADEAALRCFNRAISALGADEIARIGEPGGTPSVHATLFFGRRDCRHRLGLPADDWDRVAEVADQNRLDFVRLLERAAASDSKRPASAGATMLVWQREEQRRAADRWPSVFPPDIIGHHPQVERRLHNMCQEEGLAKVTLILGSVEGFAAYLDEMGGDPAEEEVRLAYAEGAYAQGRYMSWPPGRNKPCWCGSGRKYKKCCGDPRPTS